MPITCGDGPSDSRIFRDFNKHGLQLGQPPQAFVVFSRIRPAPVVHSRDMNGCSR